ncbi:OLC1v1020222C1 [Oldenlandia corymbosa var. corymbosa]|uniref:OLC1v1020222C1 n=1 Tax=Oldenlandia corymbosa var. corymbosa TaxID=529605 RepID=A0AAV1EG25_OLDCO|nr:OLC1v1020222C1 [Oldenlandia corymbosa var. corymbosa]
MEQLINFIIRPPRAEYDPKDDLLDQEFMLKGKWYQRKDLEVVNCRGEVLKCSHYVPIGWSEGKALPCVIYCHGNSGCRADGSEAAIILLPSNITVFTLDFSGSGRSGGEHVTLGWNEKDDLRAVVDYLRSDGNVSLIGLWGRSMGAVTSLMYGAEDPSIAGMVLDSPFSDLVDLMMELVDTYKIRLPKFTVKFAIQYMRRAIQKKAKFDITDLNTIRVAKTCFVPVLFGHAVDDDFIQPHHSDRIFEAYVGDKNIIKFEGDHNSPRPQFYFDSISIFFNNVLQPPMDEAGGAFFDMPRDYIGRGTWNNIHEVRSSDQLLTSPAASTEDAIRQLRTKRPVSRIEVPSDMSSKNEQSETQEGVSGSDPDASSSSRMISFELANGDPYGPHVPASIDDDEYVEYSLDSLADFPNNIEEEERMLMEAILASLKDVDVQKPCIEEPSLKANELLQPTKEDYQGDSRSASAPSNAARISANGPDLVLEVPPLSSSKRSDEPPPTTVISPQARTEDGTPPSNDTSKSNQSSPESEVIDTKATVTVVKNPSSNIVDGLLRRWDLNFFGKR